MTYQVVIVRGTEERYRIDATVLMEEREHIRADRSCGSGTVIARCKPSSTRSAKSAMAMTLYSEACG